MFKTAGLFEENPIQGNLAGVSAEIPDLFASKFDRLNPSSKIAVSDSNVLFDTSYNLTQKADWAAAATGSAIGFFEKFTDYCIDRIATNLIRCKNLVSRVGVPLGMKSPETEFVN